MAKRQQNNGHVKVSALAPTVALDSGSIRFTVEGVACTLDVLVAKMAFERLQEKHKLEVRPDVGTIPTAEFLVDVQEWLVGNGLTTATPKVAFEIWLVINGAMATLQKKTLETLTSLFGSGSTPGE